MWQCLYYQNCKCRKKNSVDKLVEECRENTDGLKTIYNGTLNDYENVRSFCTVYIALLVILFIISISSNTVFIYFHWYLERRYIETTIYQRNKW